MLQQLRSASYDAVPLLADTGEITGHVDEHDQRHAEAVAHAHEAGGLLRRGRVKTSAEAQRIVRNDTDGATTEPACLTCVPKTSFKAA